MISFIREDHFRKGVQGLVRAGYVVVYKLICEEQLSGCIVISPEGVRVKGEWPVSPVEELVQIEEQFARARIQCIQLALRPGEPLSEDEIDDVLKILEPIV
jgi:hypothetical protein